MVATFSSFVKIKITGDVEVIEDI